MTANKATRKSCGYVDGANRLHHEKFLAGGRFEHPRGEGKKMEALDLQGLPGGGLYWTRTSDPIDVNDVLYQLSQQTITKWGTSGGNVLIAIRRQTLAIVRG